MLAMPKEEIVGQRPAYVTEERRPVWGGVGVGRAPRPAAQRMFNSAVVEKVFGYYADERDEATMLEDWSNLSLDVAEDLVEGVKHLVEKGFQVERHQMYRAYMLAALLANDKVSWSTYVAAVGQPFGERLDGTHARPALMQSLAEIRLDTPTADRLYTYLVAAFEKHKLTPEPQFWTAVPSDDASAKLLLCGAFDDSPRLRGCAVTALRAGGREALAAAVEA